MGAKSSIEWTDATWNFLIGCTKCSKGCAHCYFMEEHGRRHKAWAEGNWPDAPEQYHLPATMMQFFPERLGYPLSWRQPRRIFLDSQSDLFHPDVKLEWIAAAFGVMAVCGRHTFQVLTKRPRRMREVIEQLTLDECMQALSRAKLGPTATMEAALHLMSMEPPAWPLENVWLGTSVEDQEAAARVAPLLLTPAAVRFVSVEPMVGPVTLTGIYDPLENVNFSALAPGFVIPARLDWVICGGESGKKARPMHPDWARALRDECVEAGVPFFFKQWGEWMPRWEIPSDRTYEFDSATQTARVGKKAAGRLLDGREWSEMPQPVMAANPEDRK